MADVIILNGGSSSGKTTIAKCLQDSLLPMSYLRFSIDDLVEAMPDAMLQVESGITFDDDESVNPGAEFRS